MTHEESKVLWKLEKIGFEAALDIDRYKKLIDVVDPLIESNKLSYDTFVNILTDSFKEVANIYDITDAEEDAETRKKIIDEAINLTIKKI